MLNSEVKLGKSMTEQYFTYMFKSFLDCAVCSDAVGLFFIQRSGNVWGILVEGLMRNIISTFFEIILKLSQMLRSRWRLKLFFLALEPFSLRQRNNLGNFGSRA